MDFRRDINGLRAVAVLAVMLYHFGIPGFSGGFTGVDVFFVISGYLMTGILLKAQEQGTFSLAAFYGARCRRIIPALLLVCAVLAMGGWVVLPPADLEALSLQIVSALIFTSNILFYSESGYFSALSQEKWLLHTWSLSVEWQFYLVFPFILMLLHRLRRVISVGQGLMAIAGVSLLACVITTYYSRDFAFFQLPARLWELVAGGLVYIYAGRLKLSAQQGRALQAAGLLLLAGCIGFMNSSLYWPGAYAIIPVLAACLILVGGGVGASVLSISPLQHLGTWSYSIYLWHWPAVALLFHLQQRDNVVWFSLGIVFSIIMGALSYRFVELPAKDFTARNYRLVLPALLVIAVAGAFSFSHGFPQRAAPAVLVADSERGNIFEPESTCHLQKAQPPLWLCGSGEPQFVVWGDSHALSVFATVQKAAGNAAGLLYVQSCPPVENAYLDEKRSQRRCPANTAAILADLEKLPDNLPVIMAFRYSYYLLGYNEDPGRKVNLRFINMTAQEGQQDRATVYSARLEKLLCSAAAAHKRLYATAPVPEMGVDVPRVVARQLMLSADMSPPTVSMAAYNQRNSVVLAALEAASAGCGVTVLNPAAQLCSNGQCISVNEGRPLYADDDHLSLSSDAFMAPLFAPVFAR